MNFRFKENRTNLTKKTKKSKNSSQLDSKPLRRYFSTRTSKLYDNTILQAPDGEVLSTIDKKLNGIWKRVWPLLFLKILLQSD